jgi:tripeptidyl-peptidase-1
MAYNEESDLDFEYAMTLTDPTPVTVLQTGDPVEGSGVGSCEESVSLMSALNL